VFSPEIKLNAMFGKTVRLVGVSPISREVRRGDFVALQVLWHFEQPLPPGHVIGYYLGNPKKPYLTHIDTTTFFKGRVPHGAIAPGESICDFESLPVPANAEPGDYELSVLVYPSGGFESPPSRQSKVRPGLLRLYDVHVRAE